VLFESDEWFLQKDVNTSQTGRDEGSLQHLRQNYTDPNRRSDLLVLVRKNVAELFKSYALLHKDLVLHYNYQLLLLDITFIQGIYNYIPATNHASTVYNVAAV
jgi:hypothetical protein